MTKKKKQDKKKKKIEKTLKDKSSTKENTELPIIPYEDPLEGIQKNHALEKLIEENPNKLIGCGG